jgi:hypothetical protein
LERPLNIFDAIAKAGAGFKSGGKLPAGLSDTEASITIGQRMAAPGAKSTRDA